MLTVLFFVRTPAVSLILQKRKLRQNVRPEFEPRSANNKKNCNAGSVKLKWCVNESMDYLLQSMLGRFFVFFALVEVDAPVLITLWPCVIQKAKRERRIRESQEAEAALERQVAEARAKAAAENALEDADAQSADPTAISESDTGSVQESPNEADDTPAVDQDAEIQLDTDEELAAMLEENTGSDGDGTDEQAQQPSDGGGRAGVADVPAKADTSAKSNPFKVSTVVLKMNWVSHG